MFDLKFGPPVLVDIIVPPHSNQESYDKWKKEALPEFCRDLTAVATATATSAVATASSVGVGLREYADTLIVTWGV